MKQFQAPETATQESHNEETVLSVLLALSLSAALPAAAETAPAAASAANSASQTAAAQLAGVPAAPDIAATAYLVTDLQSNQLIAAKNPDTPIEPPLTKLMTAYLTFKHLEAGKLNPNRS